MSAQQQNDGSTFVSIDTVRPDIAAFFKNLESKHPTFKFARVNVVMGYSRVLPEGKQTPLQYLEFDNRYGWGTYDPQTCMPDYPAFVNNPPQCSCFTLEQAKELALVKARTCNRCARFLE